MEHEPHVSNLMLGKSLILFLPKADIYSPIKVSPEVTKPNPPSTEVSGNF